MAKRILILSASIGAGHVKAAEALCQSYVANFSGEACNLDFFRYSTPLISRWVEQAYYLVTKHTPAVYKLLYEIEDRPNSPIKKVEAYIGLKKYRAMIESYRPDAIICTHFLPAAVASYMYPKYPIPNGVVLTDYISHPMWVHANNQMFFVAHEGMVEELKNLGVAEEKVKVTGIPIRPMFSQCLDKRSLREKLHLDPDLPLILLMSGGNAIGPLDEAAEALAKVNGEFQVVAITGRNRKYFHELKHVFSQTHLRGRVLGFIDNIHEWMAASDLLISKAGGLTVSEALASGLPMLLIRPTPGQEDGNTRFLTDAGAGIYLKNLSELQDAVENLIKNPEILVAMGKQARSIARPNAATEILQTMLEL
ncbi:MAG TPA: glycosyltransferase [Bacillota bacterium]|nr:glycosyltransferase [Bacillota bacterium]